MSRHQPVCEFPGLLSQFYLFYYYYYYYYYYIYIFFFLFYNFFFDPDVFYNPKNENELLASMDIDHPVGCVENEDPKTKT